MTRKLLLLLIICLVGYSVVHAQDPSVGGIASVPNSIPVSGTGTVQGNFGNGSSTAIPQSSSATYTVNLPPSISATSASITPTAAATNITTTIGAYDPMAGTIITFVSNLGPVPGNANYLFTINILGVSPTGATPAPLSINASATALGTNVPGNDNATGNIIVTPAPMPVSLISFTAKVQENRTVALAWSTSMEFGNRGFLIERSKDLAMFERVGEVGEMAANSSARKNYAFIDQTPFSGTSYYRLSQIDLTGKTTVYPAVSVVLRDDAYGIFPNPVVGEQPFRISLDEPETAIVRFYNLDGRLLPLQKTGFGSGNLWLKSVSKLPTGIYVMTVEERGQTRKHRVVME